jgi:hypothetical protein
VEKIKVEAEAAVLNPNLPMILVKKFKMNY